MITRRKKLIEFVTKSHDKQLRKYTHEPYVNHVIRVAELTSVVADISTFAYEIALCHDLIEDTHVTTTKLIQTLVKYEYDLVDALFISDHVIELTDYYTKSNFPFLTRKSRKDKEAIRLSCISDLSQTVKCLDISDNISDIVEHDAKFATTYLREKLNILNKFHCANWQVHNTIIYTVKQELLKLT